MQDEHKFGQFRSANESRLAEKSDSQADGDVFKVGDLVAEGQYRIVRFLGRGAIGSVFCVSKADSKELFALKTLNNAVSADTTWLRFQKEIDAATRLNHPNLVKAVDFGLLEDDRPFMVMEFVEGITLSDALRSKGRLSTDDAFDIFIPLADALSYAHREKVVHRDIKPSNIMLQSKDDKVIPKLVDFGIARVASESGKTLTQVADVFGTPLYMSPEQCVSAIVDQRSDIYSLGCVLFEALTGAPPFSGDSSLSTMMQHKSDKPPSLQEASLGVNFGKGWEELVAKMLAKDPAQRYQNCEEVLLKLKQLKSGDVTSTSTTQESLKNRVRDLSRRDKKLTGAVLLLSMVGILLVMALGAFLFQQWQLISKPAASATSTTSSTTSTTSSSDSTNDSAFPPAYGLKFQKSFHTLVQDGVRHFAFPSTEYYGVLVWWDKNHKVHAMNAIKPQSFPVSQKLILELSEFLIYEDSSPLAVLKDGDLNGVRIREDKNAGKINGTILDTNARLISTLSPLASLNLLDLDKFRLEPASYRFLKQMTHLKWLRMNQLGETEELAKMSFIPNLRVLILVSQKNVTPVLRRLSPTNLHTLVLNNCVLSDHDFSAVGKLHGLKTFSTQAKTGVDVIANWLQHLTTLHHLERLSFCLTNVKTEESKKLLKVLEKINFKTLVIVDVGEANLIPDAFKAQIVQGLKGREVMFVRPADALPGSWFNYREVDPASQGIW